MRALGHRWHRGRGDLLHLLRHQRRPVAGGIVGVGREAAPVVVVADRAAVLAEQVGEAGRRPLVARVGGERAEGVVVGEDACNELE